MASFEALVQEAAAAPVDGWDFSWLDGRATEERPSWGYQRLLSTKLAAASAALDVQTGGGEVLAGAGAEYFLRKVIWTVPGFRVTNHLDRLRAMHEHIEREGVFRSSMSRTLLELRKPTDEALA